MYDDDKAQEQLLNSNDKLLDKCYWVKGKNYDGPLSLREILSSLFKSTPVELFLVYSTVDGPVVDYSSQIKGYDECNETQREIMDKKERESIRETGIKYLNKSEFEDRVVLSEDDLLKSNSQMIANTIKKLLNLGISSKYIEETIGLYYWSCHRAASLKSEIFYHKSGEKAQVPTSILPVDYEYLQNCLDFYEKQRLQLEAILLKSPIEYLYEEKKKRLTEELVEKFKTESPKILAWYNACDRYAKLNTLGKIKAKITKKTIEELDYNKMSTEQIESLYSSKKRK